MSILCKQNNSKQINLTSTWLTDSHEPYLTRAAPQSSTAFYKNNFVVIRAINFELLVEVREKLSLNSCHIVENWFDRFHCRFTERRKPYEIAEVFVFIVEWEKRFLVTWRHLFSDQPQLCVNVRRTMTSILRELWLVSGSRTSHVKLMRMPHLSVKKWTRSYAKKG